MPNGGADEAARVAESRLFRAGTSKVWGRMATLPPVQITGRRLVGQQEALEFVSGLRWAAGAAHDVWLPQSLSMPPTSVPRKLSPVIWTLFCVS